MTNKSLITKAQNREFTQPELVLAVLQYRKKVTTDILMDLGIKSPSGVICKLNKPDVCINSKLISDQTPGSHKGKRQAEYTLITSSQSTSKTSNGKNNMMEEM